MFVSDKSVPFTVHPSGKHAWYLLLIVVNVHQLSGLSTFPDVAGVPAEHADSLAGLSTGMAAMHFALLPFLLRRPPFSQHRHAPHDCVSTVKP